MSRNEILIIDDEPQIRKLLEITLKSNDYKTFLAETGHEGILLAANSNHRTLLGNRIRLVANSKHV